jgi:uncharacterized protein with ParB-like and HNH nuclease domain
MPDFYTTEKRTLGVVLSNTTPPLRVPDYQRDFSWEEQQVSEFWNDLEHFDQQYPGANINGKEYFLGASSSTTRPIISFSMVNSDSLQLQYF